MEDSLNHPIQCRLFEEHSLLVTAWVKTSFEFDKNYPGLMLAAECNDFFIFSYCTSSSRKWKILHFTRTPSSQQAEAQALHSIIYCAPVISSLLRPHKKIGLDGVQRIPPVLEIHSRWNNLEVGKVHLHRGTINTWKERITANCLYRNGNWNLFIATIFEVLYEANFSHQCFRMKEDFTAFLADRGITEPEYLTYSGDAKGTIITAFEISKQGNCRHCFP